MKVGPFVYTITTATEAALKEVDAKGLMGHCDHVSLIISLREDLALGAMQEVLVHEILHACYNAVGQPLNTMGKDMDPDDIDEFAVTTLSPILLQVLRANPTLLVYLGVL